jgi:hypothetical protein
MPVFLGKGHSMETLDKAFLVEYGCMLGLGAILLFLWLH